MKKLLFILSLLLLMSCEESVPKTYKVELNSGEVYHVKAHGYWYWDNDKYVEFYNDCGVFFNVKCVTVVYE